MVRHRIYDQAFMHKLVDHMCGHGDLLLQTLNGNDVVVRKVEAGYIHGAIAGDRLRCWNLNGKIQTFAVDQEDLVFVEKPAPVVDFFEEVKKIAQGESTDFEIRTFSGTLVQIIFTVGRPESELIGYVGDNQTPSYWNKDGVYYSSERDSKLHLKLVRVDLEGDDALGWVAIIKTSLGDYEATPLMTRDQMDKFNHEGIVAKKKILKGEGL